MLNEIYTLAETGQFDDALSEDSAVENGSSELIANFEKTYASNNAVDNDSESDYIYDDLEYLECESRKSELHINKSENHLGWADKMDFMKVKTNTSKATDKSDRATSDRVLDDRSCKIMHKMIRQNVFQCVKGNISAGKEANVYYAPQANNGPDLVIKVYMTSIMPFKARDKYMEGDFRFRNANVNSSTSMVRTWAEKEFRNLIRISETNGAIPCPKPIKLKSMVLVMTMIGSQGGQAAPKLKDIQFEDSEKWTELYEQILGYVRILFQECRLIHADLSEYNLLYYENKIWMIDVSQSVEHFHPHALNFLRKDCHTVNAFFRGKGIRTLSLREFFDFVVDPTICKHTDENFYSYIHQMIESSNYCTSTEDDDFFLQCHIPRNLNDVLAFVKDYKKLRSDSNYVMECPYASVTGMTNELKDIRLNAKKSMKTHKMTLKILKQQLKEDNEQEKEENEGESGNEEEIEKKDAASFERPLGEDKESKKLRKKLVKESQREKRVENKQKVLDEKARTISGFKKRQKKN